MPFYQLPTGGSPVLAGNAPPTGGIGNDGDLFIDRLNKSLYGPKAGGVWPPGLDLVGTGPTGGIAFSVGATAPTAPSLTVGGAIWLDASNGRYFVRYENQFIEIGVQGEQGPTGSTGAASNVTGPTGAVSTVPGPTGSTGSTGAFPFAATGPTAPTQQLAGAVWLDTSNGRYFVRYENQFVEIGVQGEPGPTGPSGGPTGAAGVAGATGPAGSFASAQEINARVTGYTLALSDAGRLVTFNTTGSVSVVIPPASSVAFATGTHVDVVRLNTGTVRVTGATGVTVNGTPGFNLRAQYSSATCILFENNRWLVVGDLSS